MIKYIVKRVAISIPTIVIVAVLIFVSVNSIPGDPAVTVIGTEKVADINVIRERMGLNHSITERLVIWLKGLLRGDLGESFFLGQSVWHAIKSRLPVTISLATVALLIAVLIGVPLGIIASLRPNSILDVVIKSISLVGVCTPEFFLGLIMMLVFSLTLKWLPTAGYVSLSEGFVPWLRRIILPASTFGFGQAAYFTRIMYSSMLEALNQDYVLTARAKGQNEFIIVIKHAFRNALLPIVTAIGMVYTMLLGGAFITETLFSLPGTGRLIITSITKRDYPVIQGTLLLLSSLIIGINLIVDILYAFIDPRVRFGEK